MSQPESSWRIIVLFHSRWMRISTACLSGIAAMAYAVTLSDTTLFREQAATSLQATMFVFGVTVGLATYLVSNYVRGLHRETLTTLTTVRSSLRRIFRQRRRLSLLRVWSADCDPLPTAAPYSHLREK